MGQRDQTKVGVGLCASCRFMRIMKSDRDSTFYMCERSATDPAFPKYPRLPVLACVGYEKKENDATQIPASRKSGGKPGTGE